MVLWVWGEGQSKPQNSLEPPRLMPLASPQAGVSLVTMFDSQGSQGSQGWGFMFRLNDGTVYYRQFPKTLSSSEEGNLS